MLPGWRRIAKSFYPAHETSARHESFSTLGRISDQSGLGVCALATDSEIMEFAAKNDYVVLTYDLDFGAILAATKGNKPSVVQLRTKDISVQAVGRKVTSALRQTEAELSEGALLTIDEHRTRIRLLPIKRDVGKA